MKIWILNHYATDMLVNKGGRHYWLAKYLKRDGYEPVVFSCNAKHGFKDRWFKDESLWFEKYASEIDTPFVVVQAPLYEGNGKDRIINMISFYHNVQKAAKGYSKLHGKPEVIYASSVHPLTLVAGIKLAKYFGVKCISEVRDLWPESIVAYDSKWSKKNPLIKLLYVGEKWIYKKSDYLVMTWPGGYDYIRDKGWTNDIPKSKFFHISNGVDLESYRHNVKESPYCNNDLLRNGYKNFIYTGSIRKVNNLSIIVSAARILKEWGNKTARIVVFGDGNELESLKNSASDLDNIVFAGRVPKQNIPSILSQGYVSILHNSSTELNRYGQSQNKFFEYLAAGRPILMTYSIGHSVIRKHGCGIELDIQTPEAIAQAIKSFCDLPERAYQNYCQKALECAQNYDYKKLCGRLIKIIDSL